MLTQEEKVEMVRKKDIYQLGISILEFMMGQVSKDRVDIALKSIPEKWHELKETTLLIKVLNLCIN